jgi:hypothetical protein
MSMIFYSNSAKINIFHEYIDCLKRSPKDETKLWTLTKRIVIDDTHKFVFFVQVVPNHKNEIIIKATEKVNIIIINTEQLTDNCDAFVFNIKPFFEFVKQYPNVYCAVADYSQQNIDIIKKNEFIVEQGIDVHYLPYQYRKEEVDFLKSVNTCTKKVATCGVQSEYRLKVRKFMYDEYGINVVNAMGFSDDRDKIIGEHKILLNINAKESFTIYEHIRCDRWLFAGKVIISEHKLDEEKLDIYKLIEWCNYKEMPEKIFDILENYDKYIEGRCEIVEGIIENRRRIYDEFFAKLR